jgi:hypothetical protein
MNVPNDLNPREAAEALRTLARALEAYMVENGARLIDESDPEMPMTISFGGYRVEYVHYPRYSAAKTLHRRLDGVLHNEWPDA